MRDLIEACAVLLAAFAFVWAQAAAEHRAHAVIDALDRLTDALLATYEADDTDEPDAGA